jgi:uncharacterized phage protein (TIGR02218 family)
MRTIQAGLAAHLAGGATTLARCWRLTRRDGAIFGFTDHDADLVFDGIAHAARSGLQASEAEAELGFAVGSVDVAGVLHAAGITEADIAKGLYDAAEVAIHLVDWTDVGNRQLLDVMTIGEIRRGDSAFVAELRGAGHRFDEERGRLYTARCGADLGDARCRAAAPAANAWVTGADGGVRATLSGLSGFASGWFTAGRLAFVNGSNAGHAVEIREHRLSSGVATVELWLEAPQPILVGDVVQLTPGCDKTFRACREKFANGANFQGFPHMPGSDFLLETADRPASAFDGGSLFR